MSSNRAVVSLITPDTTIKASSTLDKSVGKKHLVDGSPETCWTSKEGLPQTLQFTFPHTVVPTSIALTFQGGFVGTACEISTSSESNSKKEWTSIKTIYPEDVNREQRFSLLDVPDVDGKEGGACTSLKMAFTQSSDFFGRVTLYDVRIEGVVL